MVWSCLQTLIWKAARSSGRKAAHSRFFLKEIYSCSCTYEELTCSEAAQVVLRGPCLAQELSSKVNLQTWAMQVRKHHEAHE